MTGPMSQSRLMRRKLRGATAPAWAAPLRPLTLLAATDGNHGRAVARAARWFGLDARIYIPDFVSAGRRKAIEAEGAELDVTEGPYDAAVDAALEASYGAGTLLITDTARAATDLAPQMTVAGYEGKGLVIRSEEPVRPRLRKLNPPLA